MCTYGHQGVTPWNTYIYIYIYINAYTHTHTTIGTESNLTKSESDGNSTELNRVWGTELKRDKREYVHVTARIV
jgi:hypothetical protein